MFPSRFFATKGLFPHLGAWIQLTPPGAGTPGPVAGLGVKVLHRSFRVLHHLERCAVTCDLAAAQFQRVAARDGLSLSGVRAWSPLVETAIVELVAAFADLRVLQDTVSELTVRSAAGRESSPTSLHDVANALRKQRLGHPTNARWVQTVSVHDRDALVDYWDGEGKRLADYRNIDQHTDVLARGCVLVVAGDGRVSPVIQLPDNPEVKSRAKFTYDERVHGLDYAKRAFMRIHDLVEAVARARGVPAGAVPQLNIDFQPPLALPNEGVAALIIYDSDLDESFRIEVGELPPGIFDVGVPSEPSS